MSIIIERQNYDNSDYKFSTFECQKLIALIDKPNLPSNEPLPVDYELMDRKELHSRLKLYIADLLENNFEKLCNMMYRHDVPESRFNEALDKPGLNEQADSIADVVIEREMQKVETRRAYRKSKDKDTNKQING